MTMWLAPSTNVFCFSISKSSEEGGDDFMLGKVSHPSWLIEELTKDNHFGFTTSLSEVDITLESRSSRRPLLRWSWCCWSAPWCGNEKFLYFWMVKLMLLECSVVAMGSFSISEWWSWCCWSAPWWQWEVFLTSFPRWVESHLDFLG